ncbi:Substrate-binding region of ABC-type glycine betaine transport system [Roseovarius sp. EC-HK134]|uniref:glycine betaine ABC transporter substrate-binding protein n=1 Tax=Roseovarius TaxID=74030 RepID=UPI00125B1843|nr:MULTISPECIES: glycine betaine ABC transporter substrate-binding protein [Roseovarius]MBW4974132.1 ABC transporter [Roseovarius mucosus]VVT05284.1 Substrate-binding region of ABC-type glycine betaine transport system [Roseovarius sp. EC-SD190]VVT05512.1 Substrate-binding region of ABC-type glycine betaine transport system [Roseovarius sp. EC-HK134]
MKNLVTTLATSAALFIGQGAQADNFVVGTKNFTEQFILGEIYAAALESIDIPVERKINLGGTLIAHAALTGGDIDMYPEYTGTALSAVVKGEMSSDAQVVYDTVKSYYDTELDLKWLEPAHINNGYAMLVRRETAEKYNLKTLSDLGVAAPELSIGGGPEFPDRADGLVGLRDVYGAEFREFRMFAKLGLRYDALAAGQIDVNNGFATDWQIAAEDYVVMEDDKGLFPPYFVAPVVRKDALEEFPGAEEMLNRVSDQLDNDIMRTLNKRVEVGREEARDVAQDFLKSVGIID